VYIIYGTEQCVNCKTLKNMLDTKNIKYKYKNIPDDLSREEFSVIMDAFNQVPRTFPQVVKIDCDTSFASYVGGFQEVLKDMKN